MNRVKVVILGSSGFVGQNLVSQFAAEADIDLYITARTERLGHIHFDILRPETWEELIKVQPDFVIDASGYGVVKHQTDLKQLYQTNYLAKRELIDYLNTLLPSLFWIQIGTAFEYSLDEVELTENTPCFPKTHYGISKSLFSNYLQHSSKKAFTILRPFGMFGEGEDFTKLIPLLILAQKNKVKIDLSDGLQRRDYFYVKDLANFLVLLIKSGKIFSLDQEIVNIGTGQSKSVIELANVIAKQINAFDPSLWKWGTIPQRTGENDIFFNASSKAKSLGFKATDLEMAFQNTVNYYNNL